MQLLLDHWWQFSIIIFVCAYSLSLISKASESIFTYLKELLNTLLSEFKSSVAARRAGAINLTMLFISGGLAFAVSIPSLISQLGFINEQNNNSMFVGPVLFVVVAIISSHYCLSVEKQLPAFKDKKIPTRTTTMKQIVDEENKLIEN